MCNDIGYRARAYQLAQESMAKLKTAVLIIIDHAGANGQTNVEIGRTLGVYTGHKGHEGHIPRTLLEIMAIEGVVEQDGTSKRWRLRKHAEQADVETSE